MVLEINFDFLKWDHNVVLSIISGTPRGCAKELRHPLKYVGCHLTSNFDLSGARNFVVINLIRAKPEYSFKIMMESKSTILILLFKKPTATSKQTLKSNVPRYSIEDYFRTTSLHLLNLKKNFYHFCQIEKILQQF